MAKTRAPRLKVFQAQLGFFDSVVAVSSKAAALDAWGTRQDLFATGDAKIAADEAAIAAALKHPGMPLQRSIGTKDPFRPETHRSPKVAGICGTATKRPAKPEADRTALDSAEAEFRRLDERHERAEAELQRAQADLQARRAEAQKAAALRKEAAVAVSKARAAYEKAGGQG